MKLRSRVVGAVAVSVLALAGVGACDGESATADYPGYESVDALYAAATLVVEARIADGPQERSVNLGGNSPMDLLVYQAEVDRTYKGDPGGRNIEIKQHEGETPLVAGTSYVLFLETYDDVPASLLNPTQAQYVLTAGPRLTPVGGNTLPVTVADLERLTSTS